MARLAARIAEIDGALAGPKAANASDHHRAASDLMRLRGEAEKARAASEANWLAASEALELAGFKSLRRLGPLAPDPAT